MASALISPSLIRTPPLKSLPLSTSKTHHPAPLLLPSTNPRTLPAKSSRKNPQFWRISAAAEDALPPAPPLEAAQQAVPAEGVSTVVSSLLVIAFVGLSLLTVGVVYLAVQDFLRKRETEKFEKEEAAKKKKGRKKAKAPARAGPRGFGQKVDEEEDDV